MRAQSLALSLGDIEVLDAGEHQLVDLVHRIGDRCVRADERAFHAAGAEVGIEVRHLAAEQALVLPGAGASGHEQAGAGQHRRFGDGALAERRGDDLIVVLAVEKAGARGVGVEPAHLCGDGDRAGRLRRWLRLDGGELRGRCSRRLGSLPGLP